MTNIKKKLILRSKLKFLCYSIRILHLKTNIAMSSTEIDGNRVRTCNKFRYESTNVIKPSTDRSRRKSDDSLYPIRSRNRFLQKKDWDKSREKKFEKK